MSASSRSETQEALKQELRNAATSSLAFDRDLAAKIGTRLAMRRSLCGLSKLQLGQGWASTQRMCRLTSKAKSG